MALEIVILAGGKGKRMQSQTPKVLHPVAGIPMIERVIMSANQLKPTCIHVIYNETVPEVKHQMAHLNVNWVAQATAKGTAHALSQAMPHLSNNHQVLVLNGDAPLLKSQTLQKLLDSSPKNGLGIIITSLDDPTGYGRIIRNDAGNIVNIIEEKDASSAQKTIQEVYPGICTAKAAYLKQWLPQITDENLQKEFYLTDLVKIARKNACQIDGTFVKNEIEIRGVNNLLELVFLEKHIYRERANALLLQGVTIRDPERFILRGSLNFGKDIVVDVNVLLEGIVSIGSNTTIGANTIIIDSEISDNVIIDPNCVIKNQRIASGTHVKSDHSIIMT